VLIYNGDGMEGWIDQVLGSININKTIVVEAAKGLNLIGTQDKNASLKYDPHVWLNPLLAKKEMETIKNAFVKADPKNTDFYEKNYADNAKKLEDLDKEFKDTIAKYSKKDIVVAHQAFGYLCSAYGLNQVAIEGLSAESEPSPARMAEISDFVKKNNIRYIFFENLISPKVAQAIANEAGAKTEVLNPLEGLSDEQIHQGKEYFSVMRDNLNALSKALE
jgi:zinc transport system substrate-binding protein